MSSLSLLLHAYLWFPRIHFYSITRADGLCLGLSWYNLGGTVRQFRCGGARP